MLSRSSQVLDSASGWSKCRKIMATTETGSGNRRIRLRRTGKSHLLGVVWQTWAMARRDIPIEEDGICIVPACARLWETGSPPRKRVDDCPTTRRTAARV